MSRRRYGPNVHHVPAVLPLVKMDTPRGLFRGACSCGWRSSGIESKERAKRSARQHATTWNTRLTACSHRRRFWCARSFASECPDCGGSDACCDRPELHVFLN